MARKTFTSSEVKSRWNKKTYTPFQVNLRKEDDVVLIEYIMKRKEHGDGITDIFREALEALMEKEKQ